MGLEDVGMLGEGRLLACTLEGGLNAPLDSGWSSTPDFFHSLHSLEVYQRRFQSSSRTFRSSPRSDNAKITPSSVSGGLERLDCISNDGLIVSERMARCWK